MQYRADIQILRGLSVLVVVAYHMNLAGFANGFLGVDIFLVISGYLMTRLYAPGQTATFFAKRAKRLLPGYFVVILGVLVSSVFWLNPPEFDQVNTQTWFALGFASNIGFWLQNSYFAKAEFNPLLHLWSLGVEIQFYLVVPLLIFLFRKTGWLAGVAFVGSIGVCMVMLHISPKTAFFLLPFRLWEFLIGYFAATWRPASRASTLITILPWLACAVLVGGMFLPVNGNEPNFIFGHPGAGAILVTLATGIILSLGLPARLSEHPFGKILEKTGEYSYSIYLVHFPVIVLVLYRPFQGTILTSPGLTTFIIIAVLVILLSLVLYHGIEKPFRRIRNPWQVMLGNVCLILAISAWAPNFVPNRFTDEERRIFSGLKDKGDFRCGRLIRILQPGDIACQISPVPTRPKAEILFIGNSHANSIKEIVSEQFAAEGYATRFLINNYPLMTKNHPDAPGIQEILAEIRDKNIKTVLFHYSIGGLPANEIVKLAEATESSGVKFHFLLPVPTWHHNVPRHLYEQHQLDSSQEPQESATDIAVPSDYDALTLPPNMTLYETTPYFCQEKCRMTDQEGHPLYYDTNHLTLSGAKLLAPLVKKIAKSLDQ